MQSSKQKGEIYLLSLDTFMILAISGICIGIIFIVFNIFNFDMLMWGGGYRKQKKHIHLSNIL